MAERTNNLDGKTWLKQSFSIWRDIEKNGSERKLKHPAMFPEQLASRLIGIFSRDKGEVVLDPFLGSGTTAISACKSGKKGVGFEISKNYVKLAKSRIDEELKKCQKKLIKPQIYNKSAFDVPRMLKENSVDLVITSPPYWDILNSKRTADGKTSRNYGNSKADLGNMTSYLEFLNKLKEGFRGVHKVLKKGKYCIVVVMDIRKKSKFYPFHTDLANKMQDEGFELDDIIIWDRQREYNNMRPLGYPFVFRVNKVHEFVLIFKKR